MSPSRNGACWGERGTLGLPHPVPRGALGIPVPGARGGKMQSGSHSRAFLPFLPQEAGAQPLSTLLLTGCTFLHDQQTQQKG